MGRLTEDMSRLSGEIRALHALHRTFVEELASNVNDLRSSVSVIQGDFRNAQAEMSRKTKADLLVFVSNLKRTVSTLRQDVATDLASVHRIWHGLPADKPRSKSSAKPKDINQIKEEIKQEERAEGIKQKSGLENTIQTGAEKNEPFAPQITPEEIAPEYRAKTEAAEKTEPIVKIAKDKRNKKIKKAKKADF